MSCGFKIINSLKQLSSSSTDYQSLKKSAKDFFGSVYNIGISDYKFTVEEKSVVGNLIHCSLANLQHYLSLLIDDYDSHSLLIAKYDRSSLQFLLDNYKDFPISNGEKLEKYLSGLIDSEDLEQWDNYLLNYIEGEEDAIVDESSEEYQKIPKSHWWWFK